MILLWITCLWISRFFYLNITFFLLKTRRMNGVLTEWFYLIHLKDWLQKIKIINAWFYASFQFAKTIFFQKKDLELFLCKKHLESCWNCNLMSVSLWSTKCHQPCLLTLMTLTALNDLYFMHNLQLLWWENKMCCVRIHSTILFYYVAHLTFKSL